LRGMLLLVTKPPDAFSGVQANPQLRHSKGSASRRSTPTCESAREHSVHAQVVMSPLL